ncbi:3-hydroxyacyl-CoA dehydrogenase NAD-binding domain-containing protein [Aliiglaciecola sp. CAU 1673]|uniref:3-hydroxyacyl-CoA dehydrogenase NAD-binding domain-containing protein n=1 Tax=Aliiglaciecola sp. CAU 1673 TaxID=3032595 RepID=UPI0023DA4929|nr:3-hydroxyacyl-CoA dehydrogenase NAD-binding domain-containing protein [Aliiglaciecola sp. CAU 1673]MDF2178147.1 3-hydroxyacyl-CoA dehydrogenase NAD-binding domain-containing protein [Aliiglaciecola sp. CAU 1673]
MYMHMKHIKLSVDEHNILHLTFDRANSPVILIDPAFCQAFSAAVEQALSGPCVGVILRSAKSTYFAGGDIDLLYATNKDNSDALSTMLAQLKAAIRRLECGGKPVVACINGAALGGGFELALGTHRRLVVDDPRIRLGLPEVNLGLLPGAGGLTRMVRMLGLTTAMPYLTEGKLLDPQQALQAQWVHQLADNQDEMLREASQWILSHPQIAAPYSGKEDWIPGGRPNDPKLASAISVAPAMLRQATRGNLPAPEAILCAMVEGAMVDFDSACRIERRYFMQLAQGAVSKNLINTFWYGQNALKSGFRRPSAEKPCAERRQFTKVGVLGAGMMGAGIAWACASKGIEVVLKDQSIEQADKGKDYSRALCEKAKASGKLSADDAEALLARIHTRAEALDLCDCELVIEAVFEDREVKRQVIEQAESVLSESAIFASNTSTLPIGSLAKYAKRPAQFVGLHFFSPVDKMPLVEIIRGEQTSDDTLAGAYDLAVQLGKTPIVVNDGRGFFTSRVFAAFVKEGIAMLQDAPPALIENAAYLCGFPVGPLAVSDEVSLSLFARIKQQTHTDLAANGQSAPSHAADNIIDKMLNLSRSGRSAGKGFYDYPKDAEKQLWPLLSQTFLDGEGYLRLEEAKDRLLCIMALETVRILEEGVLQSVAEANLGAIMGLGFPVWTGGPLQFINYLGVAEFVRRCDSLSRRYGQRFEPTQKLRAMADAGQQFMVEKP